MQRPSPQTVSIKWPVRVTPLKKPNRCWLDHFIPAPGKRTPLYCDLSELHPQKKSQSKLVGPLYTRSRAENASIKWPVRVTPLKKHQPMLVARTTLYPLPSRERLYKVACLGYTPAKNQTDVGWTTLYPLPSRERLYKVACPGYTPEKTPADVGWTTLCTSSPFHPLAIQSSVASWNPRSCRMWHLLAAGFRMSVQCGSPPGDALLGEEPERHPRNRDAAGVNIVDQMKLHCTKMGKQIWLSWSLHQRKVRWLIMFYQSSPFMPLSFGFHSVHVACSHMAVL